MWETQEREVPSPGQEDLLGKSVAIHTSVLAWRISRTGEPGLPQSIGLQSQTQLSDFAHTHVLILLNTPFKTQAPESTLAWPKAFHVPICHPFLACYGFSICGFIWNISLCFDIKGSECNLRYMPHHWSLFLWNGNHWIPLSMASGCKAAFPFGLWVLNIYKLPWREEEPIASRKNDNWFLVYFRMHYIPNKYAQWWHSMI